MNAKLSAKIIGGTLVFKDTNKLKQVCRYVGDNDVEVTIGKTRGIRSTQLNRYYWGVVIKMLSDETGNSRDTIHEMLKDRFGIRKDIEFNKRVITVLVSSSRYTNKQFIEYTDKVREWAEDFLNYRIPLPNEVEIPDNYFKC